MKTKHKAKDWFENLFAYGESQLSALFGTRSDLCADLEKKGFSIGPSPLSESEILYVRNYKSQYFDKDKKEIYTQSIKATGLRGIAIWKPVWEYLISQIPNAYTFSGKSIFVLTKQDLVQHNKDEEPCFDYYLGGKVPSSPRLLEELYIGEEQKEKQVYFSKNLAIWSLLLSFIPLVLSITVSETIGIGMFCVIISILGWLFYSKNKRFKKFFFIPRKKIFQTLFPNKHLVTDDLGEYYALGESVSMIGINLFADEQVGALYHRRLLKEDLNPSYVQLTCYISLFTKDEEGFHRIVRKRDFFDPIMFFEEKEVIIIPFEEIDNNPIMEYLIKNIDISTLDIPKIISDYVSKKINTKSFDNQKT